MHGTTDTLNAALADDQIKDAIAANDDPDHPGAWTVADVRTVLERIVESTAAAWGEWCDNIERGDSAVIAETDDLLVLDTGQHNIVSQELEAQERELGLDDSEGIMQSIVTQLMHDLARERCDRNWGTSWPFVVPLPEDGDDRQILVDSLINGLIARGLTASQAWAHYGVEIRGESQSRWAARQDRDQSQISKALKQAQRHGL